MTTIINWKQQSAEKRLYRLLSILAIGAGQGRAGQGRAGQAESTEIYVNETADTMGVSVRTINRDILFLETVGFAFYSSGKGKYKMMPGQCVPVRGNKT